MRGVKLPHNAIVPIHRSDASGDTFIFTQYLTFTTPSWEYSPGYGTTIAWAAAPNASTADGNAGMIAKIHDTPYSIGYVGVSFHEDVAKAGIGTAAVRSYDGEFLLPTPQAIEAAAAALWPRTPPDERLTLVNAPGANAYPLINYEYAVVSKKQPSPETAAALRSFLAVGDRARRNECAIPRQRQFHPSAGPCLGAQPRPDRRDQVGRAPPRSRRTRRKKAGLLTKARLECRVKP